MSSLKIKDTASLDRLLKIVAEESVVFARQKIAQDDILSAEQQERQRQLRLVQQLNDLSQGKEKPEAVEEEDDDLFSDDAVDAGKEGGDEAVPDEDSSEEDVPDEAEPSDEVIDDKITYTMIKEKLNTIRSGKSLKDDEIKVELKTYFKKLGDEEKIALHTFLSAIAGILTTGLDGQIAKDPSDDPDDIEMTRKTQPKQQEPTSQRSAEPIKQPKKTPGGEDTSPPIQVGKQKTEALRRKVRELMGG